MSSSNLSAFYINDNFEPNDRLAVVLLNKQTGDVIQRIATARKIAGADFQAWLRFQNANRYEVYLSMNALSESARGRTKADVETIRHLYLDFDRDGTAALERLLNRKDLPPVNYVLSTSPDKWQVIWKVEAFGKDEAEQLQRDLAKDTGADPAATDCSRVLRIPGFYNHKYGEPHLIRFERLALPVHGPERFENFEMEMARRAYPVEAGPDSRLIPTKEAPPNVVSQSERDWAYAKRALARGESEAAVATTIANYRRYDKHNPQYYAELTVRKASQSLQADAERSASEIPDR